jgi:hypothetical protein
VRVSGLLPVELRLDQGRRREQSLPEPVEIHTDEQLYFFNFVAFLQHAATAPQLVSLIGLGEAGGTEGTKRWEKLAQSGSECFVFLQSGIKNLVSNDKFLRNHCRQSGDSC